MSSVHIRDVRKSFGGFEVLHGVTIPIEDGAFVVLVGPSGCGKSTLLRMLAGLENITSGTISIGDRVVNNVQPKERDIAMVFQNYALYPHMTVADNMGFSLKLRGANADEINKGVKRAAEILALTPLLDRYPRQLSGGQRQRVAMGRAIVRDPQVFLFDEPLSNLDAKLRVAMRTEIKELHQRLKTTTVYVTHDQIEAMTMADKIVVMHDGIVEQIGTPLELYDKPDNQFVAGFIGSPAMNFLPCRLEEAGDKLNIRLTDRLAFPVPPLRADRDTILLGKGRVTGTLKVAVSGEGRSIEWTVKPAAPQPGNTFLVRLWGVAEQTGGLAVAVAGQELLGAARQEFEDQIQQLVAMGRRAVAAHQAVFAALPESALGDACHTLNIARAHHAHRFAVAVVSIADARAALAEPRPAEGAPRRRRLAFLFSGQGSQYAGMGLELYREEPAFREVVDRCAARLTGHSQFDPPLLDVLFGIGEAGAWPNVAKTFSRWFPSSERGTAQCIFFMGAHLIFPVGALRCISLDYSIASAR